MSEVFLAVLSVSYPLAKNKCRHAGALTDCGGRQVVCNLCGRVDWVGYFLKIRRCRAISKYAQGCER